MDVKDTRRQAIGSIDALFGDQFVEFPDDESGAAEETPSPAPVRANGDAPKPRKKRRREVKAEEEWKPTPAGEDTVDAYGNAEKSAQATEGKETADDGDDGGYNYDDPAFEAELFGDVVEDDDDDVVLDDDRDAAAAETDAGEGSEVDDLNLDDMEEVDLSDLGIGMPKEPAGDRDTHSDSGQEEPSKKRDKRTARSQNWKKDKKNRNGSGERRPEDAGDDGPTEEPSPAAAGGGGDGREEELARELSELKGAMAAMAKQAQASGGAKGKACKWDGFDWEPYESAQVVFEDIDGEGSPDDVPDESAGDPSGYDPADDDMFDIGGGAGDLALYDGNDDGYADGGEPGDYGEYEDDGAIVVPDWVVSLRSKLLASVAHAFLLNGNIRDYMVRDITIKEGIVQVLDPMFEDYDVIAEYDQAHGLHFYGTGIETTAGCDLATVYRHRFIRQMREIQEELAIQVTDDIPNRDPVTLFTVLSRLFDKGSERRKARMLLFVDYSDFLVPDASAAQMKPDERKLSITLSEIGRSTVADETGNCMLFLTDDMTQLSSRIRSTDSRIELVHVPLPTTDERRDFIEHVLDVEENCLSDGTQLFEHPDSIDKATLAINTAGLNCMQIENVVLRALADDEPLSMQLVKERKNEIIIEDYDNVLEIVDSEHGFERIGGLQHLKDLFSEEIIEPVHTQNKEAVPMGVLLMGPPGTSKACTAYSPLMKFIPGQNKVEKTTVGELLPDDYVFGLDGYPYRVESVTVKSDMEVYELELNDGRVVETSGDHVFSVLEKSHGQWRERLLMPTEMIEKGVNVSWPSDNKSSSNRKNRSRFQMRQCQPLQFPEADLPLNPYVMGVFLGDGCRNSGGTFELSSMDEEIVASVAERLHVPVYRRDSDSSHSWHFYWEYDENESKSKHRRVRVRDIAPQYEALLTGVYCGEKWIPEEYKYASVEQRFELLRGLLDTDGSIDPPREGRYRCNIRFGTTATRLRDDLMELLYGLGITCTYSTSKYEGRPIAGSERIFGKVYEHKSDLYEIHINVPNEDKPKFFHLSRKKEIAELAAAHPRNRDYSRIAIKDVRATGRIEPMRCISVASPDHLFLVGDCVPTHNTFLSRAVAKEANMNFVALNLNRIMEKWVGSTERNLDRALECAMAMSPTIIFIDEIDEALPNRADPNASAVNKRINQRLLTFFAQTDHRGDVIILAATNYPEKVDPAFKRAGRFDIRIPMFAPDEYDRMRIMQVIAKSRGYTFNWFESPDKVVRNLFDNLGNWLRAGNYPEGVQKVGGDQSLWHFKTYDNLGKEHDASMSLSDKLIAVIDKPKITLQQLYETVSILFYDLPPRKADESTGIVPTDEEYFEKVWNYLMERSDMVSTNEKCLQALFKRIQRYDLIYQHFANSTMSMTGAELDVVMNKAISLWRKAQKADPTLVQRLIDAKQITDERDIPWEGFLERACATTISAASGIKLMEDNALLNTSDSEYIPDARYAESKDGRAISYKERHQTLILGSVQDTLGDK